MHASSIINYHHNHHHQHYYAHQAPTEESNDASGLSFGPGRSLVTPHQTIESDDNEESAPETNAHLAQAPTAAATASQDNLSSGSALTQLAGSASHKVHFVGPYEGHENSHEHYRYNNSNNNNSNISNDNAAPYQLISEAHYYGGQQLINSAGCHQAVDLRSEHQQHQHGQFEAPSAIYYDLSAAEHIPSNQVAPNLTPLDYQHQEQHHNHLDIDLQQRQEQPVDLQRDVSSFASYGHYEPSSELRYSGEVVSVLAEQNRAARPLEWQDSRPVVAADQTASSDGCHHLQQYSYEFVPILRPPDGIQLDRNGASNVAYTDTFNLAPTGGGSYGQQMDSLAIAAGNGVNFHLANNENYHQTLAQHPNDCHLFHDKQLQQAQTQFSPLQLDYEPHGLDSGLAGHHNNQHQASREAQRDSAPSRALSSVSDSLSMTTNSDMESIDSALTRDEKKAREANIPLSYHEIVNLSIDQFNEQLSRFPYTETQLNLMKDIRRRGKNKVAAQTCRKRKMEQITELQQEVAELANKRILLALERSRLVQEHVKLSEEYESWRNC